MRERESVCVRVYACVCVRACMRVCKGGKEKENERKREKERESEFVCVSVCAVKIAFIIAQKEIMQNFCLELSRCVFWGVRARE